MKDSDYPDRALQSSKNGRSPSAGTPVTTITSYPDDKLVEKYHKIQDESNMGRENLRNLQAKNHQAKKHGKQRLSANISEQKDHVKALEKRERDLRRIANNQVINRGGIVDSGHDYASKVNLGKPPPVHTPSPRQRKDGRRPDERRSNDAPADSSRSKGFAHKRADEAAIKRSGLSFLEAERAKARAIIQKAPGQRGGRNRNTRRGNERILKPEFDSDNEDEVDAMVNDTIVGSFGNQCIYRP